MPQKYRQQDTEGSCDKCGSGKTVVDGVFEFRAGLWILIIFSRREQITQDTNHTKPYQPIAKDAGGGHPVNGWVVSHLLLFRVELSIFQNSPVNHRHQPCVSNILKFGPRLRDYGLHQIVLPVVEKAYRQAILIGVVHVNTDVCADQYDAYNGTCEIGLEEYDGQEWNEEGDLHIDLQWPCLLVAAFIRFHFDREQIANKE